MAKSKAQTHQINGEQLSYSWLGTDNFLCKKWIDSGFIAVNLSLIWYSHQIPLYLQLCVNKTDIIGKTQYVYSSQNNFKSIIEQ